jgi:hypothetical protein
MGTFIVLSRLTDEGRKTLKQKPERLREVNEEIAGMGAKVVEQYALLGEYDCQGHGRAWFQGDFGDNHLHRNAHRRVPGDFEEVKRLGDGEPIDRISVNWEDPIASRE